MKRRALSILVALTAACLALLFLQGCATSGRQKAVPAEATAKAEIPGMPGVRYILLDGLPALFKDAQESLAAERKTRADIGATGPLPPVSFLAVSGGGDNGAYGAGMLNGWTAAGNRPEFKLVTGISTGALIAPFAFLGSKYDSVLREFYTGITPKDILEERNKLSVLFKDALADNAPLKQLVRKVITADMLEEIAGEHAKGRILLVATTNMDARRPVIWNMTKIAASGHPKRLELFQDILVASAAIPGAFPPTMMDVEVDGQPYQEMHVDGGTFAQVFVYPAALELKKVGVEAGADRDRTLYIIRNSKVMPEWSEVERKTLPIAGRAIASLIQTQGIGDLYRIYAISQRDEVDYNLAYIPESLQRAAQGGVRHGVHARAVQAWLRAGVEGLSVGEAPARNVIPWRRSSVERSRTRSALQRSMNLVRANRGGASMAILLAVVPYLLLRTDRTLVRQQKEQAMSDEARTEDAVGRCEHRDRPCIRAYIPRLRTHPDGVDADRPVADFVRFHHRQILRIPRRKTGRAGARCWIPVPSAC